MSAFPSDPTAIEAAIQKIIRELDSGTLKITVRIVLSLSLFVATVLGAAPVVAAQNVTEPTPAVQSTAEEAAPLSAEERLEELDQRTRIIERRYELDKEEATAKAKTRASVDAGPDGFSIRSADKSSQLKIKLLVQADGRFYLKDDDNKAVNNFLLRRARPTFEGVVANGIEYRFTPDFAEGKTTLFEAYADLRYWKPLSLRVGKFKPPVGLERLQSASAILFVERAFPTQLVPSRDIGAQLHGEIADGILEYQLGVFNGVPDGGNLDTDIQDQKDIAARVFTRPFKTTEVVLIEGFGIGVAGTTGWHQGSLYANGKVAPAPYLPAYRTPGQRSLFAYNSDNATYAGTVVANGKHTRFSPQGYHYAGPVGILGEYVLSSQEVQRGTQGAKINNRAYQIAGSIVLTGEDASFKGVTPKDPFDPATGNFGALEIAGRFHRLMIDREAFPIYANLDKSPRSARAWAAGLNWYATKNYRVTADFERTIFEGGEKKKNRDGENTVFTRFQVSL